MPRGLLCGRGSSPSGLLRGRGSLPRGLLCGRGSLPSGLLRGRGSLPSGLSPSDISHLQRSELIILNEIKIILTFNKTVTG